jgi:serine/threonine-protein kinase
MRLGRVRAFAGGRYVPARVLGRGGMSVVYLARDTLLDRFVAIKLLAGHLLDDEGALQRFEREARAVARLSHPGIVQVFDVAEDERGPYLVLEYVPGASLADVLVAEGRLSAHDAASVCCDLAAALAAVHAAGLVHRDVKPHNILIGDDGRVRLGDFGIAQQPDATRLTSTGLVLGTAAYLAPEQATGADVTGAADVYALGIVLLESLSGRHPESPGDAVAMPGALAEIATACLASDPARRPTAGWVAEQLRAWLRGTHTGLHDRTTVALSAAAAARPTDLLHREGAATNVVALASRRRRGTPVTVGIAALVLALVVASALLLGSPSPTPREDSVTDQPTQTTPVPAPTPVASTTAAVTPQPAAQHGKHKGHKAKHKK